jgi:hypothetical protein
MCQNQTYLFDFLHYETLYPTSQTNNVWVWDIPIVKFVKAHHGPEKLTLPKSTDPWTQGQNCI